MSSILFIEQKRVPWFRERTRMRKLLETLFKREKTKLDNIQFIFLTDDELLEINRQFLAHDFYTDIITFDLSDSITSAKAAEIYISVERVEENAKDWNTSRINELRRVMVHGCLHLCGYKDKLKADKVIMRKKEDFYLQTYNKSST